MIYGSVCSGIEAATVAWHPLGWRPSFFSEIEKFQRTVLSHRYPQVPLHGDFTTIGEKDYDAKESSLSDILEIGDHLRPYYLSRKHCEAMLLRAKEKKQSLPKKLTEILMSCQ